MQSTNNRTQTPTENLHSKLFEVVSNYTARTPVASGAALFERLIKLIHSRRVPFLRSEAQFRSLWLEDISGDPAIIDFFLNVSSDFSFAVSFDGQADVWDWGNLIDILSSSIASSGGERSVINEEVKERLAVDQDVIRNILINNPWAVTLILLQKMPLSRLASALDSWRSTSNNQSDNPR